MKKSVILLIFLFCFSVLKAQETKDTSIYKTETIEVDALKGVERVTPITFSNIKRETIEQKYWMQDLPMFLNGSTSINSYSESGASVGYSYFFLRGFDQKRISITIDGIPQNDAEDHQVYWVDLSDITSSVENIQIQRGIGTALYGTSSIGGAVNIRTIDFFNRKFLNVSTGLGDFNSKRFSLEYSSGMVPGGLGVYGKFTRITTDGYRDGSWSDHWSYFLSAGKIIGDNSVLKINVYGGPIKNHLAYYGITQDYLNGQITGDPLVDRKYNPITYSNETDNYNQPHYELTYNIQPTKNLYISNTLSYTRGDGYFVTSFPIDWGYDFSYFHLPYFYTTDSTTYNPGYYRRNENGSLYYEPGKGYEIVRSNIVTNLYVNNDDYGWYPKVQLKHNNDKGTLVVGGELMFHTSEHFGQVTFSDALPPDTPPDYEYYFFNGKKRVMTIYANEVYNLSDKLTAMLGAQFANQKYSILNEKFAPYTFDVSYNFFTPRAGLNYNFNDNLRAFVNVSMAKSEPRLKDIYDGETLGSRPNFRIVDTVNNIYQDPLVEPEEMLDYEAGISYKTGLLKTDLNFYYMDFRNEIVNSGQLDNVGQPVSGNAAKSVHRGIELEMEYTPFRDVKDYSLLRGIFLGGNLTFSENYFKDYKEKLGIDSTGNIIYGNDYSGNKILLSPQFMGNLTLGYSTDFGLSAFISMQYIGKQYLDNSEDEKKNPEIANAPGYIHKIIEPYTVFNAGISWNISPVLSTGNVNKYLKRFELTFRVNNLFNRLYEATGNVDSYGTPTWIPAATRNFYMDLKVGF